MNEKPFTADEIFNACALIIERKIFRRTPESVAVNQRRERKMLLAGIFVFVVAIAISMVLKSPLVIAAIVAIFIFAMITLSLFNKDYILAFNEDNPFPIRREMMQIYQELDNQRETDKEAFARAYLAKAKAEYDAQTDAKRREIFGEG